MHESRALLRDSFQTGIIMTIAKPTRRSEIAVKDIGGETLLYGSNQKILHVLNSTAKLIWNLCDGQHSLAEIEQSLRLNFSVPVDHDVMVDIEKTLEIFASKDLLLK